MARDTQNPNWAGSEVGLTYSFTKDSNRLIISQSWNSFTIKNRTTKKVVMRADYHHVILKRDHNGLYTIPVKDRGYEGPITVPKKATGEEYGLWTHDDQYAEDRENWNPFRTWDFTGESGASYKLDVYVAVRHEQGLKWGDNLQVNHDKVLHL